MKTINRNNKICVKKLENVNRVSKNLLRIKNTYISRGAL